MGERVGYIAQAWVGKDADDARVVKIFDSTEDAPGVNSFDLCRKFIFEQLETNDYAAMRFVGSEMDHVKDFEYGAFSHPERGRCMFEAVEGDFEQAKKDTEADAALPIYSPNELYAMKPTSVDYDTYRLFEHWLNSYLSNVRFENEASDAIEATKRIQIRHIVNIGMGSDESWELATLWWKPVTQHPKDHVYDAEGYCPVAVLTYRGDDWDYETYITDHFALADLIQFVLEYIEIGVVDPNKKMECYTEFYHHTLHDFYDVATGKPKRPRATGPMNKWGNTPTDWWHHGFNREEAEYAGEEKK